MKLWQIAALLTVVGIVYVMVRRPTVPVGGQVPASSNDLLSNIFKFATAVTNKVSAPSAVDPTESASVYRPGESFDDYTSSLFGPGTAG